MTDDGSGDPGAGPEGRRPDAATLTPLARRLREARERAGLTQRELARRMGVSRATVAEAELGADPRHSTLQRFLDALPALSPGAVLCDRPGVAPVSTPSVWRCLCEVAGFVVGRLAQVVVVGSPCEAVLELGGVRALRPVTGRAREARRGLMRAVYRGSPERLQEALDRGLDVEGELVLDDGSFRHAFRLPADPAAPFGYRREAQGEAAAQLVEADEGGGGRTGYTPGFPVELLELAARFSEPDRPAAPRHEVHVAGQRALTEGVDLVRSLRPGGVTARWLEDEREVRVAVRRPEPYLTHELHWEPPRHGDGVDEGGVPAGPCRPAAGDAADDARGGEPEPPPLSVVVREARRRCGLSQRALAGLLGTSPMTIGNVESGKDPRIGTLRACLEALELRPEAVLRGGGPDRVATPREAWAHYRDLYGIEADEESKELVLDDEGWAAGLYRTRRLRSLRPRPGGLVVSYGAPRTRLPGGSAPPDSIELDAGSEHAESGFRTRFLRRRDGRVIHQLSFSESAAVEGVSYTRRVERVARYALHAPHSPDDDPERAREGHGFTAAFPVERLVVGVRFPGSVWPEDLRSHVWPTFRVPELGDDLKLRLHPEGLEVARDRRRRRAWIEIEEPLVGVEYALSWLPPGS